jgi:proteic killer suppression protein
MIDIGRCGGTPPVITSAVVMRHVTRYILLVIVGFRHRGLKRLFERGDRSRLIPEHVEKIENILAVLNRASVSAELDLPGFRLHALKGELSGYWAVTVRANWRIVFRFEDGHATDVDLLDYH